MKNILQHSILAGLFLLLTSGFVSHVLADGEGTPAPAPDSVPIEQDIDPQDQQDQQDIIPVEKETEDEAPPEIIPAENETEGEPQPDIAPAENETEGEPQPEVIPFDLLSEPSEQAPENEVIEPDAPAEGVDSVTEPTTETTLSDTPSEPTATSDPTPVPAVADPQAIAAKVIAVDRIASTLTLEVNGKSQLVHITPQVRILKKGKLVTFAEITSGQNIVLLARTLENGTYEVVSVAIGPAKGKAEAAGRGKALGVGFGQRVKDNPPFFNFPNPANSLGPIISVNN